MAGTPKKNPIWHHWPRLLLLIPFLLVAYVPFYNRIEPTLIGIPFFYWYQLAAILVGAVVVMTVYLIETRRTRGSSREPSGPGGGAL